MLARLRSFDGTHVANTWALAQLVGANEPALELKFLLSPGEQNEAHTVLEAAAKMCADELSAHVGRVPCHWDQQPASNYTPWVESADYMHFFARYLQTRRPPALWALSQLRWRASRDGMVRLDSSYNNVAPPKQSRESNTSPVQERAR